jgi:hypothetical protein
MNNPLETIVFRFWLNDTDKLELNLFEIRQLLVGMKTAEDYTGAVDHYTGIVDSAKTKIFSGDVFECVCTDENAGFWRSSAGEMYKKYSLRRVLGVVDRTDNTNEFLLRVWGEKHSGDLLSNDDFESGQLGIWYNTNRGLMFFQYLCESCDVKVIGNIRDSEEYKTFDQQYQQS